jgi:uncharacterized damage-inducible protein DinB
MNLTDALIDSWDRQCRIVNAVASRIDAANKHAKPSEDGWTLDHQLAHIHKVRQYFLSQVAAERSASLPDVFVNAWDTPIDDLAAIKSAVVASGDAVRCCVHDSLNAGSQLTGYDHPVLFLQHMIWHEGWHVGLIFLGLRLAGQEPPEEWEEANVWGEWRTEVY